LGDFTNVAQLEEERVGGWGESHGLLNQLIELFLQSLVGLNDLFKLLLGQELEVIHHFLPELKVIAELLSKDEFQLIKSIAGLLLQQKLGQLRVVMLDGGEIFNQLVLGILIGAHAHSVVQLLHFQGFSL